MLAGQASPVESLLSDKDLALHIYRIKTDPWYFCQRCVFTLDQADKVNPIKKFPSEGPMAPYLKLYTRMWQRERFIAVPKSRRMFMSWMNIILYTHDTAFNVGRNQAFVSKKEDDADDLIKRAKFILDNIPASELPRELVPKYEYVFGQLRFHDLNSKIQAFPQGADQLRQFTFSGILADELAFWDKAQETYAAAFPTLEGGGRFTAISSAGPGFFKDLVFDRLDQEQADE